MRLGKARIKTELAGIEGWRLHGRRISRLLIFEEFLEGIRFLNRVAKLAEAKNHHPDIDIRYNKIKLSLTTHDEGGLTIKDFRLARQINRIRN